MYVEINDTKGDHHIENCAWLMCFLSGHSLSSLQFYRCQRKIPRAKLLGRAKAVPGVFLFCTASLNPSNHRAKKRGLGHVYAQTVTENKPVLWGLGSFKTDRDTLSSTPLWHAGQQACLALALEGDTDSLMG